LSKTPATTKSAANNLNILHSPEKEVANSALKRTRIPFQSVNTTPRMFVSFDDCEGIPVAQATGEKGTVFLGNQDVAQNLDWLLQSDIKAIVNATSEIKNFYPNQFTYKKLPLTDSEDCKISKYFDDASDFINEHRKSGSILIHCQKGQSRSVTLIFSYLIKNEGMSLSEVWDFFERNRIKTTMNIGFQQQLMLWEKKITNKNTKDFFARTPRIRRTPQKFSPGSDSTYSRLGYVDH